MSSDPQRALIVCGALVALLVSVAASAQDGNIAFVDMRKAVFSSREGREAQQQFARANEKQLELLKPRKEELIRLEEEFERQKFVLSDDAVQSRQLELRKRKRDLERDLRAADDELQLEQIRLLQPIQKKLSDAVAAVGKEKGLVLIIDKQTPGLLYHKDSLDVTDLVVKRLNEM